MENQDCSKTNIDIKDISQDEKDKNKELKI